MEAALKQYRRLAYNLAYQILGDYDDAQDAVQDAYVRAWQARGTRVRYPVAWLMRIVKNEALRQGSYYQAHPTDRLGNWEIMVDYDPTDRLRADELLENIEQLDPDRRHALTMFAEAAEYHEIAEATGVPIGTVKSRISRARCEIRDSMRETGETGK